MEQKIILACVIVISLIAHVWIYRWIKFKMDEGAVIRYLKDIKVEDNSARKVTTVAQLINMSAPRVESVCDKSLEIYLEGESCFLTEQ